MELECTSLKITSPNGEAGILIDAVSGPSVTLFSASGKTITVGIDGDRPQIVFRSHVTEIALTIDGARTAVSIGELDRIPQITFRVNTEFGTVDIERLASVRVETKIITQPD